MKISLRNWINQCQSAFGNEKRPDRKSEKSNPPAMAPRSSKLMTDNQSKLKSLNNNNNNIHNSNSNSNNKKITRLNNQRKKITIKERKKERKKEMKKIIRFETGSIDQTAGKWCSSSVNEFNGFLPGGNGRKIQMSLSMNRISVIKNIFTFLGWEWKREKSRRRKRDFKKKERKKERKEEESKIQIKSDQSFSLCSISFLNAA